MGSPKGSKNNRRSKMGMDNIHFDPEKTNGRMSKPLYSLKDQFRCLFCGSDGCKHEDWTRNKKTVIVGLNCDRINPELFASQRPSTVLIEKYNIIKQFKE